MWFERSHLNIIDPSPTSSKCTL